MTLILTVTSCCSPTFCLVKLSMDQVIIEIADPFETTMNIFFQENTYLAALITVTWLKSTKLSMTMFEDEAQKSFLKCVNYQGT